MKTIIAGGRKIVDYGLVVKAVKNSKFPITEVFCGTPWNRKKPPVGADQLGAKWGDDNNVPVRDFAPKWKLYGNSAGIIRNGEMAHEAEALIAIWDGISSGTKNMIEQATKRGLNIYVERI